MKDTSPEMESKYREGFMSLSGAERLKMGCSMFDTSRELIRASFRNAGVPLEGPEYRVKLFLRVYGNDFDEETKSKILAYLGK